MNAILAVIILMVVPPVGPWSWMDSLDDSKSGNPPVVHHDPPPEPPPAPAPVRINRKDSRGINCWAYTERDLDIYIRGRESVYAEQAKKVPEARPPAVVPNLIHRRPPSTSLAPNLRPPRQGTMLAPDGTVPCST